MYDSIQCDERDRNFRIDYNKKKMHNRYHAFKHNNIIS